MSATLDQGQLAIAAVLTLTSPFTPMLFMGEEWGASTPWQFFTAHPEPDLAKETAEGRIHEFEATVSDPSVVPDPQATTSFRETNDWSEIDTDSHGELLDLYRSLIRLRHERPDLTDPDFRRVSVEFDDKRRWIAVRRGDATVVVANLSTDERKLPYPGAFVNLHEPGVGDRRRPSRPRAAQRSNHRLQQCSDNVTARITGWRGAL